VLSQLIQSVDNLHKSRYAGHVAVGAKLRYAIGTLVTILRH
jgi:hypothetical protein